MENFPVLVDGKGEDALRQTILAIRANQRQGNASTKTRDEVSGSGKKIYRQKGLGTGRAGDKRAIQRRGGGIAFGPKPRSYSQKVNSKVRKLALARALVDQAVDGGLLLIEDWAISSSKTKELCNLLKSIDSSSPKFLMVGNGFDEKFRLASRNLDYVNLVHSANLNPLDLIRAQKIILSLDGLNQLLQKLNPEEN